MNKMDRLLDQLPSEPVPPGLALHICQTIQARQRRWLAIRLALSAGLGVIGGWLLIPAVALWLQSLALPANGLSVILDWLGIAMQDVGLFLQTGLDALLSMQSGLSPDIGYTLPGLVALGMSALMLLDVILPREDWT